MRGCGPRASQRERFVQFCDRASSSSGDTYRLPQLLVHSRCLKRSPQDCASPCPSFSPTVYARLNEVEYCLDAKYYSTHAAQSQPDSPASQSLNDLLDLVRQQVRAEMQAQQAEAGRNEATQQAATSTGQPTAITPQPCSRYIL